jgi:hypothetical protein
MTIFVLTLIIVGLVIAGMAIGVILGRAPIKGSCGGLGAVGIEGACEICGGDPQRCEEETGDSSKARADESLYYPAKN